MVEPGQTCPNCGRRVSHPKKATSPTSSVISYRLPIDEEKAHKESLEAVARYIGTFERPHWQFWTQVYALARVLQDPEMQGIAQKQAA